MSKPSIKKRKVVFAGVLFCTCLAVFVMILYAMSPVDDRHRTMTVEIPIGSGFRQIVQILDNAGLVKNKILFYGLVIVKKAHKHIHAGEYEFSTDMTPSEIIDKLVKGIVKAYKVTIPEDLTIREVAVRLASLRLIDEKEFYALAKDKAFLKSLNIQSASVEGFMFPNTYNFTRSMGAREIIKVMVNQFWKSYTPEMRKRAENLGWTTEKVITLASLIGKESGFKEEKSLIAAVFHNRLKKGMKLQSDPTAVYDLNDFNGAVKKGHLRRLSPYNTYVIDGLPPGPIANPGIDSIYAALFPASVDYLYFVSNGNGSHLFSSSFSSHQDAIQYYQRHR
jgi:UPF0755 protein